MAKELILTIPRSDFKITATTGSGKGGQHQNKTATKVRIVHIPSGAAAVCNSERSQLQNKKTALELLSKKPQFLQWLYNKIYEDDLKRELENKVNELMSSKNIQFEYGQIVNGEFIAGGCKND